MESSQVPPAEAARQARGLVIGLYLSAAITIVVGIALGIALDPVWFGLVLLGLVDVVLAALFAGGRIGPLAARRQAEVEGDAAAIAESDPAYNPYARED
jgi:hypothetical protein